MTNLVERIIARAERDGFDVKYWNRGDKFRIYADSGRRDAKVFLELDDADASGASLKVFIDDCGQAGAWYASQKAKLNEVFKPLFLAYAIEKYSDSDVSNYGPDIQVMVSEAHEYFKQAA